MDQIIIIPTKGVFKEYWANFEHFSLNDKTKAIKDCVDILLELNRISNNPKIKTNVQVIIPKELRLEVDKKFSCITFADNLHDAIARIDDTTSRFDAKIEDIDEAILETAKIYNDTHQILIISDCEKMKEKVEKIANVGVFPIMQFSKSFSPFIE